MSRKLLVRIMNRNPRNLEMLGLQPKPLGYELNLDRHKCSFIYKARLLRYKNYLEAQLLHYKDGGILSATSREVAIESQLYSRTDTCAAINLGRILAVRCLMSGIYFAIPADSEEVIKQSQHLEAFYKALEDTGLILKEIEHTHHNYRNDSSFCYDRYQIHHNRQDKTDEV